MNVKKIVSFLLILPAFSIAQDKFEIKGKMSGAGKDKVVVLTYVNPEGKSEKDTAQLTKGKFSFSGTTLYGNKAYLELAPVKKDTGKVRRQPDYQQFYLSGGKYKVTGKDSMNKAAITGTPVQAEFRLFNEQFDTLLTRWRQISQEAMKVIAAKDTPALKEIQARAKPLYARMNAVMDSFIYSHPDSYVSLDLVLENKSAAIDPETFDPFYTALSERVLNSFNGKKLTAKYDKARTISVGKTFDFAQADDKGNLFKLSSLRGKYVLVDFWASWCKPCRVENPFVVKAYNHYKDKNFEIVGISLDDNKTAWLKAVEKDGLPWIHVSDLKGWKNDVAIKYGISAVPQNVLVDPNGVIIAKNLRGEDLETKLSSLFDGNGKSAH